MLMPSIFGENLFDDFFDFRFPDFGKAEDQIDKKLYGHHAKNLMAVDIKEKDNEYEMIVDLPGFTKDEISAKLENGYLTISASKGLDNDEKDKETGKYIRRERYAGACQRTFYIGDRIKQEDIRAEFKHGILTLGIPKNQPQIEQKNDRFIQITG